MAPPPPPSASYLWKFDSDDDSECSEEEKVHQNDLAKGGDLAKADNLKKGMGKSGMPSCTASKTKEPFFPEGDAGVESVSNPEDRSKDGASSDMKQKDKVTKSKRKRQNRKKKKKKITLKAVRFGNVEIQTFERSLGMDGVPGEGGWPLGLGDPLPVDLMDSQIPLDDYETGKQKKLRERLLLLQSDYSVQEHETANDTDGIVLETRQWDYRRKSKNPLFRMQTEQERMVILLASSQQEHDTYFSQKHAPDSPGGSRRVRRTTRPRSGSGSFNTSRSTSGHFTEQYNNVFTQIEVHHCRNELEELRISRTNEGSVGCTCRKLQVYLLPPNAGKKAHHRRMNLPKVKEELRKRHLLPKGSEMSRDKLELLLHDAVENEACCSSDCPCARNNITCQADTCSCWYVSHQTKHQQKLEVNNDLSPLEIRALCGNPVGTYIVDLKKINAYRSDFLSSMLTCKEIE